jgi:hypothetical protein
VCALRSYRRSKPGHRRQAYSYAFPAMARCSVCTEDGRELTVSYIQHTMHEITRSLHIQDLPSLPIQGLECDCPQAPNSTLRRCVCLPPRPLIPLPTPRCAGQPSHIGSYRAWCHVGALNVAHITLEDESGTSGAIATGDLVDALRSAVVRSGTTSKGAARCPWHR